MTGGDAAGLAFLAIIAILVIVFAVGLVCGALLF